MTKKKKTCPVEKIAREVANLIRLQDLRSSKGFIERTNLGDEYACRLIGDRQAALCELAQYEVPTSKIGVIFQLLMARCVYPIGDLDNKVFGAATGTKLAAESHEDKIHQLIESVLIHLTSQSDDPDVAILSSRYGGSPEGRANCQIMDELKRLQAA